jgi:hypothetical protein
MTDPIRSAAALKRAADTSDEIERSVWLAMAADYAIRRTAVLVGGAAVNLYTGSYRPTDVDLCAYLDPEDRDSMSEIGFVHLQGDHFAYTFEDGERWLLEFPDSQVDGDVQVLELDPDNQMTVITLEALIVDRILQATDGTGTTFDEALRLWVAVIERADWAKVESDIAERDALEPGLGLLTTYQRLVSATNRIEL